MRPCGRVGRHLGRCRIAGVRPTPTAPVRPHATAAGGDPPGRTVLFLAPFWPEANASAAGVRTASLIRGFQRRGWSVAVGSPAARNAASASLASAGVAVVDAPLNRAAHTAALLSSLNPALVVFDKFWAEEAWGHAVWEGAPGAARVLDMQDAASLRRCRGRAVEASARSGSPLTPTQAALAASPPAGDADAARELAAILRCDASLVCSPLEGRLLRHGWGVPASKLLPAPFFARPVSARPGRGLGRPWEERRDFVMVGHHGHAPNADGLAWLTQPGGPWDAIAAACPGAELHVWGAYESGAARARASPRRRIFLRGRAPSLAVLARARVLLAPLRFGAGLKGKILEAWARGTPVCTTPVGAEGWFDGGGGGGVVGFPTSPALAAPPGGGGGAPFWWGGPYGPGVTTLPPGAPVPADCPEAAAWGGLWTATDGGAFAADAARLYSDRQLWEGCAARGRALHDALAGADLTLPPVLDALEGLGGEALARRRAADHVGAALWAAGNRATEFFARWVELKETVAAASK